MTIHDAVRSRILGLCEQAELPLNHLAVRCGLSPAAVNRVLRAGAPADLEFLQAICSGFGLSVAEFFAAPIFRDL